GGMEAMGRRPAARSDRRSLPLSHGAQRGRHRASGHDAPRSGRVHGRDPRVSLAAPGGPDGSSAGPVPRAGFLWSGGRMRRPRGWVFGAGLLVGALGTWVAMHPGLLTRPAPAQAADLPSSRRNAIVTAAQRVSPAVVSVSVVATRTVRADPFPGMPHDEF